jgi:hypothetical protein
MAEYVFKQPIRYYKANDPYYYEVDNIPLRQLEENILYVKGLVEGTANSAYSSGGGGSSGGSSSVGGQAGLTTGSEIDITMVKQLRPRFTGGRQITVNAGIFNSRINDAYDINKALTELTFGEAPNTATTVVPQLSQVWTDAQRDSVWNDFIGTAAASKAYNVNGLDISYTFYSTPGTMGSAWGVTTNNGLGEGTENYPKYAGVHDSVMHKWPGYSNFAPLAGQKILVSSPGVISYTVQTLPDIHLAFVKMWRGVFRTAVVDFPESSITIPAWDDNDFYYEDSAGSAVPIEADQRIDLLVAYSLPIDASSTALQDYETGFGNTGVTPSPKIITQPQLGLYKGAGVGLSLVDANTPKLVATEEGLLDPGTPGSARMVGNASDKIASANQGLTDSTGTKIHGSFPSPDDLLNMAPVLALGVDSQDLQLVGQAALPIAYVVTKKGQPTITQNDIIDIRPFLRTAELTYNERAGVAAANPPLSFANPAVGAYQLQSVIDALEQSTGGLTGGGGSGGTGGGTQGLDGKAMYTDYIMGGLAYGVEGTLLTMCDSPQGANDPFGSTSQTTTYIDPFSSPPATYTFADFQSSKAFLDWNDTSLREAFLQYIYTQRQGDLKHWLSDPNSPITNNPLTYLGLPAGDSGRNIPLFPEWDMPMDATNYATLMSAGADGIPKVTWWMWMEATSKQRALAYVPGGVQSTSTQAGGQETSYLDAIYKFGSGPEDATSFINMCSKRLQINFPSWVSDYDVIVEYVNCSPVTSYGQTAGNSVGLGGGLYVNKGPVFTGPAGEKSAVFQITSAADNLSTDVGNTQASILDGGGAIDDKVTGGNASPPTEVGSTYQFLSYAVALPQFRNAKWNTEGQRVQANTTQRYVPKMGAAYYPTIKFTVIGYTNNPVQRNSAYTAGNGNFTLLQNVTVGNASNLLGAEGPLQADPGTGTAVNSLIDIQDS